MSFIPYRVIKIYYSVTCYTNHINSTRIQSIASMALMVFPDAGSWRCKTCCVQDRWLGEPCRHVGWARRHAKHRNGCVNTYNRTRNHQNNSKERETTQLTYLKHKMAPRQAKQPWESNRWVKHAYRCAEYCTRDGNTC